MWWVIYTALLGALVVRFREAPVLPAPAPEEPLALVAAHHRTFGLLLVVVVPLEALVTGGAAAGRLGGAVLFAAGVLLYRTGVAALGDALSPFVMPHPAGRLVTTGLYGWLRHPIYLGQVLIAVGAPLTLGCRWALVGSAIAAAVVGVRIAREEAALQRVYPEYAQYAGRAKRVVPFVF